MQLIGFERDGMRFAVRSGGKGDHPFLGYCDGALSVSATRADIAARALVRKHVHGLPEGRLVDFADVRRRRYGAPE